jgi:hypothetical protein
MLTSAYFTPKSWYTLEPAELTTNIIEEFPFTETLEWKVRFFGITWRQNFFTQIVFEGDVLHWDIFRDNVGFTVPKVFEPGDYTIPELRGGILRLSLDGNICRVQVEKVGLRNIRVLRKLERSNNIRQP